MHILMKNVFAWDVQDCFAQQLGLSRLVIFKVSCWFVLQVISGIGLVLGFGTLVIGQVVAVIVGVEGAVIGLLVLNLFVRIGIDNVVIVICKHYEMG